MDSHLVLEASKASLTGVLPFSEIVRNLISAGVEFYHVDYISLRFTFYGAEGDTVVVPLIFEDLPSIAPDLDVSALRAAIRDSQQKWQKYRDFTRRTRSAGVQSYFAFLRGQRVTYLGRQGDQHTEWFPGATPREVP